MNELLPAMDRKPEGHFEIVAAGRLHPQKGFADLIAAMHELVHVRRRNHVQLRILGTGSLDAELKALASRLNLDAHVTFAGFQPNPLPFYRQADLFCMSSLYEGLPNALVEACFVKRPCSTDCPSGPREVLAGGQFAGSASCKPTLGRRNRRLPHEPRAVARGPSRPEIISSSIFRSASIQALEKLLTEVTHGKVAAGVKL
jgi:glycosyltransferase involved in cell wall biosynthesis